MSSANDYKKVTMMMENPSYDGALDGRGDRVRRGQHRMKPFVLVILLLLAVVGVAVALAIVLTGNEEMLEEPEAVTIIGEIHVANREYKPEYEIKGSDEFLALERELVSAMDRVYNQTLFGTMYVGSSVTQIREGSVIVEFEIHLEIPKVIFDLKQGEDKSVQALEYNEAYIHLVKAIDGNRLGEFTIIEFSLSFDSESLSFEAITSPPITTAKPSSEKLDSTLEPTSSLAPVSAAQVPACRCANGGSCRGDPYFVDCVCAPGWGGTFCENVVPSNPCEVNPCQHGGQCVPDSGTTATAAGTAPRQLKQTAGDQYSCVCPPNYKGHECEIPSPQGQVIGEAMGVGSYECIAIPITACCPIVPYNRTVSPNPFQLADDANELLAFFELSIHFLTPSCHPDAELVLCTILNPRCPSRPTATATSGEQRDHQASMLDFRLPCRSVCREVHGSCLAGLPSSLREKFEVFGNFCHSLPESMEESVCFKSTRENSPSLAEPVACQSSPCENGGVCLEMNDMIRCRCPIGYGGQTCAYQLPDPCSPNPCLNDGVCRVGERSIIPRFTCECKAPHQPPYCHS